MNRDELYRLRRNLGEFDQLRQNIVSLETMRISPRAAVYGADKVQTSAKGDVQPDNIQMIDSMLAQYNAKMREILEQVQEFEKCAEVLDGKSREFMRAYFIHGKKWEEICVSEGLSYRRIMQIRNDSLNAMFGVSEKSDKPEGNKTKKDAEAPKKC